MSKFDLERAKSGEPIEFLTQTNKWVRVHFVGVTGCATPIIQLNDCNGAIQRTHPDTLRMAPKKVTVRYKNYKFLSDECAFIGVFNEKNGLSSEDQLIKMPWFAGWIHTEWQTAEIQSDLIYKETL